MSGGFLRLWAKPTSPARLCRPTGRDIEGPFYARGAPWRRVLASSHEPGERLTISGTVYGPDCKTPLAGVLLDVWHADRSGRYHSRSEQFRLRGRLRTDKLGRYSFSTIRPGRYREGDSFRPAHIHFKVAASGRAALTTQLYFSGDPYLKPKDPCDVCNSGEPSQIITLAARKKGATMAYRGTFDIILT
ncbi:MAG: hypothetical protein KC609_24475 [Myxococcales bacterium]|nr:hypothetical protein [Myxococcales bacterium]